MTMTYRHYLGTWVVLRLRSSYDHDIQTLPRDMGGA